MNLKGTKLFPQEVLEFLVKNNPGKTCVEITDLINQHFATNYTKIQIKTLRARLGLISGLTGRFESGHVSHNTGKTGLRFPGSEKGWFKKGNRPHNAKPVGTEIIDSDGYHKIKVAEPNQWNYKHIMTWEAANGPVPKDSAICFLDGNHDNCSLENLRCITKAENIVLNRQHLRTSDRACNETAFALAKLKVKLSKTIKENTNEN